jgi:hypothetical protein
VGRGGGGGGIYNFWWWVFSKKMWSGIATVQSPLVTSPLVTSPLVTIHIAADFLEEIALVDDGLKVLRKNSIL